VVAEDTMMNPPLESLMHRTHSKFSLVTLAARRAREINSYFNQLGEGLGTMVPPQVSSTSRKPLSISFEEIAADKIVGVEMADYEAIEAELDAQMLDEAADDVVAALDEPAAVVESISIDEPAVDEAPAIDEAPASEENA
jgi:DNA-directed RNA polymerase subunit omega